MPNAGRPLPRRSRASTTNHRLPRSEGSKRLSAKPVCDCALAGRSTTASAPMMMTASAVATRPRACRASALAELDVTEGRGMAIELAAHGKRDAIGARGEAEGEDLDVGGGDLVAIRH